MYLTCRFLPALACVLLPLWPWPPRSLEALVLQSGSPRLLTPRTVSKRVTRSMCLHDMRDMSTCSACVCLHACHQVACAIRAFMHRKRLAPLWHVEQAQGPQAQESAKSVNGISELRAQEVRLCDPGNRMCEAWVSV